MKKQKVIVRGITILVEQDALDDQDLLEVFEEMQEAQAEVERLKVAGLETAEVEAEQNAIVTRANKLLRKALFGSQWDEIKGQLRGKDGRLRATDCQEFMNETISAVNALKN